MNITCPANYPSTTYNLNFQLNETCPKYFRWIHEDLKIWKEKGITREMVESLQDKGTHFRLVIVNGIAYVKQYDYLISIWCSNAKIYQPLKKDDYKGAKAAFAPPQFHFCGDDSTYDIVFPDWSFWGWPEINIKPWAPLLKDIKEGNPVKNWTSRKPYAFWKGNLYNGPRRELKKCNSTNDWNTVIIKQDWREKEAFSNSDLSKQCIHRAIELCSEKFACGPMGLEATFKKETMVNGPSEHGPCKLPPPYDPNTLEAILDRNVKIKQVVEMWEKGSA
uniref:Glycosyl transferase CAP10 domain-containing protein n=1 Tax=Chenopodium quinoa TaxID=63459 RepID=A0A803MPV5_CHEQI